MFSVLAAKSQTLFGHQIPGRRSCKNQCRKESGCSVGLPLLEGLAGRVSQFARRPTFSARLRCHSGDVGVTNVIRTSPSRHRISSVFDCFARIPLTNSSCQRWCFCAFEGIDGQNSIPHSSHLRVDNRLFTKCHMCVITWVVFETNK